MPVSNCSCLKDPAVRRREPLTTRSSCGDGSQRTLPTVNSQVGERLYAEFFPVTPHVEGIDESFTTASLSCGVRFTRFPHPLGRRQTHLMYLECRWSAQIGEPARRADGRRESHRRTLAASRAPLIRGNGNAEDALDALPSMSSRPLRTWAWTRWRTRAPACSAFVRCVR
jgi:hypothetical protein